MTEIFEVVLKMLKDAKAKGLSLDDLIETLEKKVQK